jgi:hypothetical protein
MVLSFLEGDLNIFVGIPLIPGALWDGIVDKSSSISADVVKQNLKSVSMLFGKLLSCSSTKFEASLVEHSEFDVIDVKKTLNMLHKSILSSDVLPLNLT